MVKVVADRLQRDAEQKLHHLLLFVACGQEVLNGLFFRIAAFADKFSHQGHEGIELGIRNRRVVVNCRYNFGRRVEESLRYLRVRGCAVIARRREAQAKGSPTLSNPESVGHPRLQNRGINSVIYYFNL